MKAKDLRILLTDFAVMNAAAALIAMVGLLFNLDPLTTFVYVTFLLSGIVLIAGGYFGFFASSASLNRVFSYLRMKRVGKNVSKRDLQGMEKPEKRGLRIVFLGMALLFESLCLALLL